MKILLTILQSKTTTIFLCLVLGFIVGASAFYSREQSAQAALEARIIYLVPKDSDRIEKNLDYSSLFEASNLQGATTSDWGVVNELISKGQLDALVIHHDALDAVHPERLQEAFRNRLVVAGIGIPAKQMADVLGMPTLNVWGDQEIYKTPSFFYMFSLSVRVQDIVNHFRKQLYLGKGSGHREPLA